mgnify:CR=1 FL=1
MFWCVEDFNLNFFKFEPIGAGRKERTKKEMDLLDIWDSRFEKSLVLVGVSLFSNGTGIEFREKHRIFKKSLRIKCYRIS